MTGAIKALGDKLNPTKRSIRAIGVAVGVGGMVGAGIAAGAVRTDNITSSTLGGSAPAQRRMRPARPSAAGTRQSCRREGSSMVI